MADSDIVCNEFMQYCDSLDEDCPVILLEALKLLEEQQNDLRVLFNRCCALTQGNVCWMCEIKDKCQSRRSILKCVSG